jgi:WD40 repeat protein
VAWSPDGASLASGSEDETVKIWNAKTGKCDSTLNVDFEVLGIAYSPSGDTLAVGRSNDVLLVDSVTVVVKRSLSGHRYRRKL